MGGSGWWCFVCWKEAERGWLWGPCGALVLPHALGTLWCPFLSHSNSVSPRVGRSGWGPGGWGPIVLLFRSRITEYCTGMLTRGHSAGAASEARAHGEQTSGPTCLSPA